MVNEFMRSVCPYPEGSVVILSTEERAVVKSINKEYPIMPTVITESGRVIDIYNSSVNIMNFA